MWSGSVRATWSSEGVSSVRTLSLAPGGPQNFLEEQSCSWDCEDQEAMTQQTQ